MTIDEELPFQGYFYGSYFIRYDVVKATLTIALKIKCINIVQEN